MSSDFSRDPALMIDGPAQGRMLMVYGGSKKIRFPVHENGGFGYVVYVPTYEGSVEWTSESQKGSRGKAASRR